MSEKKAVIVISADLGVGPAANRAAVLATGLATHAPEIIGPNIMTKDGFELLGFTKVPIPILTCGTQQPIFELVHKSFQSECLTLVFLSRAQGMRSYQDYIDSISKTSYQELDIDAAVIYGDKKIVNKITGNLSALR